MSGRGAAEANIHASCVAIGAHGVLLLGKSGAGKSDVALRLIDGGAKLVADDRTILYARNGLLQARAPDTIRGLIEIRGVGIVQLPVRRSVAVRLAVHLDKEGERLPQPRSYRAPAALALVATPPEIALDPHFAGTPARIRAALAAFVQGRFRDTLP